MAEITINAQTIFSAPQVGPDGGPAVLIKMVSPNGGAEAVIVVPCDRLAEMCEAFLAAGDAAEALARGERPKGKLLIAGDIDGLRP